MKQHNKYGFTLIELLVVVIIIAVLAAVAVPQYKKAVLKSRFSTLMPLAKSVAKGNEVYYLSNGFYADRKDKLDVEGPGTTPEGTQVNVVDSDDYNYVIASRTGLPNKYIVYQKHSPKFAENIHCEAEDKNIPAIELCKSLGGYEIGGSQTDGYVTYVLEGIQGIDDTLPTSLTKLAESLCEGKPNCTATIKGKTVVTEECSGQVTNAEYSSYSCTNTTYSEKKEKIGHTMKKTISNNGCSSSACYIRITEKDLDDTTNWTYYTNIDCRSTSISQYGVCDDGFSSFSLSTRDGLNRQSLSIKAFGGDPYAGVISGSVSTNSYWQQYEGNSFSVIGKTTVTYNDSNATFITRNPQDGDRVIKSETCATTDADWLTGSCKPGTAI